MTQPSYPCPKCGQASSETDFCSECGARIGAAGESASAPAVGVAATAGAGGGIAGAGAPGTQLECPACGAPRPAGGARFCEVCRYDFVKQTAGGPPVAAPAPVAAAPAPPAAAAPPVAAAPPPVAAAPAPAPGGLKWDAVVAIDPSLDTDPEPGLVAPPEPERRIPLDKAENLIGRRDPAHSSVPDVRPHDPSVSRRHAKLLVHADGTVAILDLESANGTFVNGDQILAGVPRPLVPTDVVTIGRWTRLRVEPRTEP